MKIVPVGAVKVVKSVSNEEVDLGIFENHVGNFAVVFRDGEDVRGVLCLSYDQAVDIYNACLEKIRLRYTYH